MRGNPKTMEISFTDNIAKKLLHMLTPAFYEANKIRFAVAFMKYSGFSLIEENLNRSLENGSDVEFLAELDFRTTEPSVLRRLRQLADKGYRLKCYCFSDPPSADTPGYHPKLYLLMSDTRAVISIGLSNLTRGGLRDNVIILKTEIFSQRSDKSYRN